MKLETCLPMLIKVKNMLIPNSALKNSKMNMYCCCLHKVNKLVEIKNEPRDSLPNVNIGKQVY